MAGKRDPLDGHAPDAPSGAPRPVAAGNAAAATDPERDAEAPTLDTLDTLEVLAERLGLTRERIRQVQHEALLKLRRRMRRQGVGRESIF